jgi:hypothetical protein
VLSRRRLRRSDVLPIQLRLGLASASTFAAFRSRPAHEAFKRSTATLKELGSNPIRYAPCVSLIGAGECRGACFGETASGEMPYGNNRSVSAFTTA